MGVLTGGGIVSIFTIPQIVKKAKAEARASEIDNVKQAVESWKEIANERQEEVNNIREQSDRLNAKIDEMYITNSEWRDKYNAKCEEIADLRVWRATNEIRLCDVKGCEKRTPPTGY